MTKWRREALEEAVKIVDGFKPSTTVEDGNILETDYVKWSSDIQVKQSGDWVAIQRKLKHLNLGVKELGCIWCICDSKFNWRGWGTFYGLWFKTEALKK